MNKFKAWLRRLAPLQAGIFYMAVAFSLYLIIVHNPFLGYTIDQDFIDWRTHEPLDRPEFLRDIRELKVLVIWLFGTIGITTFFIWLTGIRNQKSAAQPTFSESTECKQTALQRSSQLDITHDQPKLKPHKNSAKTTINNCRWKKLLLGLGLAFCVTVATYSRLEILKGRSVAMDSSLVQKAPAYIAISAVSPTFLQCLSYVGAFQETNYLRLIDNGYPEQEAGEKSRVRGLEGLVWGLAQGLAFYLPFILFRKNRSADRSVIPEANPSDRSGISTQNQNEQAQDSKENESD